MEECFNCKLDWWHSYSDGLRPGLLSTDINRLLCIEGTYDTKGPCKGTYAQEIVYMVEYLQVRYPKWHEMARLYMVVKPIILYRYILAYIYIWVWVKIRYPKIMDG